MLVYPLKSCTPIAKNKSLYKNIIYYFFLKKEQTQKLKKKYCILFTYMNGDKRKLREVY